jgi:hypothetical protein
MTRSNTSFTDAQKIEMAVWVQCLAPWKVFATHTFSWEASIWSAQKSFERFLSRSLKHVSVFYAIESNPSRDGHHIHALWADCACVQRTVVWKRWKEVYGRNRIEPIEGFKDVCEYCAKYVTKEGAWWNVRLADPTLPALQG